MRAVLPCIEYDTLLTLLCALMSRLPSSCCHSCRSFLLIPHAALSYLFIPPAHSSLSYLTSHLSGTCRRAGRHPQQPPRRPAAPRLHHLRLPRRPRAPPKHGRPRGRATTRPRQTAGGAAGGVYFHRDCCSQISTSYWLLRTHCTTQGPRAARSQGRRPRRHAAARPGALAEEDGAVDVPRGQEAGADGGDAGVHHRSRGRWGWRWDRWRWREGEGEEEEIMPCFSKDMRLFWV